LSGDNLAVERGTYSFDGTDGVDRVLLSPHVVTSRVYSIPDRRRPPAVFEFVGQMLGRSFFCLGAVHQQGAGFIRGCHLLHGDLPLLARLLTAAGVSDVV
jgi:hypothetical protein